MYIHIYKTWIHYRGSRAVLRDVVLGPLPEDVVVRRNALSLQPEMEPAFFLFTASGWNWIGLQPHPHPHQPQVLNALPGRALISQKVIRRVVLHKSIPTQTRRHII